MKLVNFRLKVELIEAMKAKAKEQGISLTDVVRLALQAYLKGEKV